MRKYLFVSNYMFNFVETKTITMASNNTTIEKQGKTIIGTINVSDYTMTATFRFTIEEQVSYYSHQTQLYNDYITDACRKLEAWELGEIQFTNTPPDYQAMIDKELNILKKINDYTPWYDLTRIVHDGVFDKAMADVFLKTLDPYPDKHQTATISLERIRWLTEHIKSTKEEHIAPPSKQEDEDTIMLRQQIQALDLSNAGKEFYPLLYTLKDAWHAHNKPWAADNAKFGRKIAHILSIEADTMNKGLNRACNLLRIEKNSIHCYPLATLDVKQINIKGLKNKEEELEKWKVRRKRIFVVMSMDIAKTSIVKQVALK